MSNGLEPDVTSVQDSNYLPMAELVLFAVEGNMYICDVICENLHYGWTNIVGTGQTPRVVRGRLITVYDICRW